MAHAQCAQTPVSEPRHTDPSLTLTRAGRAAEGPISRLSRGQGIGARPGGWSPLAAMADLLCVALCAASLRESPGQKQRPWARGGFRRGPEAGPYYHRGASVGDCRASRGADAQKGPGRRGLGRIVSLNRPESKSPEREVPEASRGGSNVPWWAEHPAHLPPISFSLNTRIGCLFLYLSDLQITVYTA